MPLKLELFSFYDVKSWKDCELLNPKPEFLRSKVRNLKNEIRSPPSKYKVDMNGANRRKTGNTIERKTLLLFCFF
ncbi:Uncharacterised protein [Myroides odoratus]|nr:hypothetical protein Myrod_3153 [Myroides odoratus DSM 2801]EKB05064.1 hypothetical protein HMPREF9716_02944 [Myroides odoratus CIP 103059]STZ31246.1 Uncharacterised protein [Myroides odoratus]